MERLTFLVIDDTRGSRETALFAAEIVAETLGRQLIPLTAESGIEGARLLRERDHIDLVLLDIHFDGSDVDGRLLSALIRELHPQARILPFTADRKPETLADIQMLGLDAPVLKPVNPHQLAERLRQIVEQTGTPQEPPLQTFLASQSRKMVELIEQRATPGLKTVALLARDHLVRAGLSRLLEKAGTLAPITLLDPDRKDADLRSDLQAGRVHMLVCTPDALRQAEELATLFGIPLLIYATIDTAEGALERLWSVIVGPANSTELVEAIQKTLAGERYRQTHIEALVRLDERQARIVTMLTQGASNEQIAAAINVSPNWIRHVMRELYKQLDIEHTRGAVLTWANEAPVHLLSERRA